MQANKVFGSELEIFFQRRLPADLGGYDKIPFAAYKQESIEEVIEFHPPFLRTEKIVIFKERNNAIDNYRSIGMGLIYPKDTEGHYNSTIYLAMCGWLMASTASVHLAYNYHQYAPQVVEADKVKPFKSLAGDGILKPRKEGTSFWVETSIRKNKLKLVLATTNIFFGSIKYGTIEELKFILAPKNSIWKAKEVEED